MSKFDFDEGLFCLICSLELTWKNQEFHDDTLLNLWNDSSLRRLFSSLHNFFLTGFFKTLPTEIEESAIMDGANPYQVFFKVMLPVASPGLISMGIFNFLGMWNQYVLPLVLISDESKYMLSQGLAFMLSKQFYENEWSALFAALTIISVPTLIVYITFQK